MHINLNFNLQFGGTNHTNHVKVADSPNTAVTLPSPSPAPQRPAASTNWMVVAVKAFAALAAVAKAAHVLAPYLGPLLGG